MSASNSIIRQCQYGLVALICKKLLFAIFHWEFRCGCGYHVAQWAGRYELAPDIGEFRHYLRYLRELACWRALACAGVNRIIQFLSGEESHRKSNVIFVKGLPVSSNYSKGLTTAGVGIRSPQALDFFLCSIINDARRVGRNN